MKLSVIIVTKNEETHIADCIASVSFADEIIVIDDMSDDHTAAIAKKSGARVLKHPMDDFASQRNYGLLHASGDWVLFLDADERVSSQLQQEIQSVVQ